MKKTDDAIEKFKELKKSGKKISLGDILDGNQIKTGFPIGMVTSLNNYDNIEYLKKFHKKADNLEKENLSLVEVISTNDGEFPGFTYTENDKLIKIFLVDADVVIEEGDDDPHELGLYELN